MKNPKIIIGIIAIIALLIIFYFVYKSSQKTVTSQQGTTVTQPSLLDSIVNIFTSPQGTGTSASGGGTPFYCKIFPKLCAPKTYCDCKKPGFASDGVADSLCNSGNMTFEEECA